MVCLFSLTYALALPQSMEHRVREWSSCQKHNHLKQRGCPWALWEFSNKFKCMIAIHPSTICDCRDHPSLTVYQQIIKQSLSLMDVGQWCSGSIIHILSSNVICHFWYYFVFLSCFGHMNRQYIILLALIQCVSCELLLEPHFFSLHFGKLPLKVCRISC